MHWLAPPPEAAPRDLFARPPTRRTAAAVGTAQQSTASPHTSSHGEPIRPQKTPAGSRLHLTTLCPGRLYTPPIGPGSPASYHRDHPQSPHSIPAEARDSIPNPAPRRRDLDAWLAIGPVPAAYHRPCPLQTLFAPALTPTLSPRH